ncbi:MAG: hypothetical protein R3B72_12050 [Polyangiaceae bacterium]
MILSLAMGACPREEPPSATAAAQSLALDWTLIAAEVHPPPIDRAVVITLDGVRWQEIFQGVERDRAERAGLPATAVVPASELMPNLHWLATARGAALGAPNAGVIAASGPAFVSLPGYRELFSGQASEDCLDNDCAAIARPTLVDELAARQRRLGDVAVFASWPTVRRAASAEPERVVLSAGRAATNHRALVAATPELEALLEAGDAASARPGYGDYRPDAKTAALALAYLRHHEPRFLFLGLGDTDEYAHQDDYRGYLAALREADRVIGEVAIQLAALSARGTSTLLVVTTDHGRNHAFTEHGRAWPESSRIWLVAAGDPIAARGRVASPRPRRLADVTATLRALLPQRAELDARPDGSVLGELFVPPPPSALAFHSSPRPQSP